MPALAVASSLSWAHGCITELLRRGTEPTDQPYGYTGRAQERGGERRSHGPFQMLDFDLFALSRDGRAEGTRHPAGPSLAAPEVVRSCGTCGSHRRPARPVALFFRRARQPIPMD
jgi:hypothetical protein